MKLGIGGLGRTQLVAVILFGLFGCAIDSPAPPGATLTPAAAPPSKTRALTHQETSTARMSPMARLAQARSGGPFAPQVYTQGGNCEHSPDCEPQAPSTLVGELAGAATRAETSIAVDKTGRHVVIGYNDFRGFTPTTVSVSGFSYSDDGGKTFTDGGQLPVGPTTLVNNSQYPQVFGDPEIKYLGHCTFAYASILMKKFTADPADTSTVETMSVHRSTDCGHTWQGPFEVTAAT